MGARSVAAVRDWNERLGPEATYAMVSHADPIRAILADALGLGFDGFLRLSRRTGVAQRRPLRAARRRASSG